MRKSVAFKKKSILQEIPQEKKISLKDAIISKSISKVDKRNTLIEEFETEKVRGHSYHLNDSDKINLFSNIKNKDSIEEITFDNVYSP